MTKPDETFWSSFGPAVSVTIPGVGELPPDGTRIDLTVNGEHFFGVHLCDGTWCGVGHNFRLESGCLAFDSRDWKFERASLWRRIGWHCIGRPYCYLVWHLVYR